ncbi:MAG: hypothetical protein CVV64_08605 [Candidatus Wallbacteria bacterium HGW-Wallbacteria-1]|jgi:serine phosphatase RsbU (regulator of sigma subunit)|uniref:PPM-type phosphatase domain-containing protein n=1 Tax=Candidatus Wallbacteria bacterium HGW-Wallbacteria-1 TaxID=2013854 RepID=A0A2N1PQ01_9BACT|nr:MAG: hypothetical protein CVV64_08605 [Candidatus Wallbacteria bacterium HGW-Wallbacteria-1]
MKTISGLAARISEIDGCTDIAEVVGVTLGHLDLFTDYTVAALMVSDPLREELTLFVTCNEKDETATRFIEAVLNDSIGFFENLPEAAFPVRVRYLGSKSLFPGFEPSSEVALPLQSGSERLGLLCVGTADEEGLALETIATVAILLNALSMALRNRFLSQEIALVNDELSSVNNELRRVNDELVEQTAKYLAVNDFVSRVNRRLEYEERQQRRRLEAICDLTDSIFDIDELVSRIGETSLAILAADSCAIFRVAGKGGNEISLVHGAPSDEYERARILGEKYGPQALKERSFIGSMQTEVSPTAIPFFQGRIILTGDEAVPFAVIPLLVHESSLGEGVNRRGTVRSNGRGEEKLIGLISVCRSPQAMAFDPDDMRMVLAISSYAAIALEKADLYQERSVKQDLERELDLARRIQEGLLPNEMPSIPMLDIAAASIPAKAIGGDFYDFIQLKDGRVGFVIADVSGKGVSAALLTNMARSVIRTVAVSGDRPAEVLVKVNNLLCDDIDPYRFVTVFYMIFDPSSRTLVYANAGHSPLLICRAGGHIEELTTPGAAIGILRDVPFLQDETCINADDVVLLFTDGLTESRSRDDEEFYGMEKLRDILISGARGTATDLRNAILDDIVTFSGDTPQHDDLTLMVLKGI